VTLYGKCSRALTFQNYCGIQTARNVPAVTDEVWRTSRVPRGEEGRGVVKGGGHTLGTFDTFKISMDAHGHETCVSFGGKEPCSAVEVQHQRELSLLEQMLGGKRQKKKEKQNRKKNDKARRGKHQTPGPMS